jgi:hypothetical protein
MAPEQAAGGGVAVGPAAEVRALGAVRDAAVYVRGRVRHADHRTVVLKGRHRDLMSTENRAAAMRHVAFPD